MIHYHQVMDAVLEEWMHGHFGNNFFQGSRDLAWAPLIKLKKKLESKGCRVIIIAGTNGKGETAFFLERMFLDAKKTLGVWTSPHTISLTERFRFNGQMIEHDRLLYFFKKNYRKIQGKTELGYYEFLFLVFLDLCTEICPEYLILEVGLGGRLDATNIFNAELAIITSISRDHQKILGNSFYQILMEKIAVSRSNRLLLSALELGYLRSKARLYCTERSILYVDLFERKEVSKNTSFTERNKRLAYRGFELLMGQQALPVEEHSLRVQTLTIKTANFVFIGAHNLDGMRKLVNLLDVDREHYGVFDLCLCAFSKRPLSEVQTMINVLILNHRFFLSLIFCQFHHAKALNWEKGRTQGEIELSFKNKFVTMESCDNEVSNEKDWKSCLTDGRIHGRKILVCGSYYFIGEVQKYLLSK